MFPHVSHIQHKLYTKCRKGAKSCLDPKCFLSFQRVAKTFSHVYQLQESHASWFCNVRIMCQTMFSFMVCLKVLNGWKNVITCPTFSAFHPSYSHGDASQVFHRKLDTTCFTMIKPTQVIFELYKLCKIIKVMRI